MEIAMNLPQAMSASFQAPPPVHAATLDPLKSPLVNTAIPGGIAIDKAHNALGMSDQFPYPADVKAGLAAANAVNFDEVIAQDIRSLHIEGCEIRTIPHLEEFFGMTMAFSIVGQYEELFGVTQRNRAATASNRGNIDGSNMPRKKIEARVVPQ
jgi:hypothetical protein